MRFGMTIPWWFEVPIQSILHTLWVLVHLQQEDHPLLRSITNLWSTKSSWVLLPDSRCVFGGSFGTF